MQTKTIPKNTNMPRWYVQKADSMDADDVVADVDADAAMLVASLLPLVVENLEREVCDDVFWKLKDETVKLDPEVADDIEVDDLLIILDFVAVDDIVCNSADDRDNEDDHVTDDVLVIDSE
jgi:hypothetical protein